MAGQDPAKIKMAELMLSGVPWQEAIVQAGVESSRSSAYRFLTAYCWRGAKVLEEQRRGHAHKIVGDVLVWLLEKCQEKPDISARELQTDIAQQFGVRVTRRQINNVRSAHGVSRPKKRRV